MVMVAQQTEANDMGRDLQFALMMQNCWKREIEEAIEKVKHEAPMRKRAGPRGWRNRGNWTPSGFAWFKRKRT